MANAEVDKHFQRLVDAGKPVGEIVGINNFLVQVRGLQPVSVHSLIIFEDGSQGFVQHILENYVVVLRLKTTPLRVGMLAAVQQDDLSVKVGKDFIGRVISVTGEPLDGKGAIAPDADWPVFNAAPPIYKRELLDSQLETGVTLLDTLFPIVRGQRLALLGDGKSGKSTLATQIAINQRSTDQIVVYVMITKRRSDIDMLLSRLTEAGVMNKSIVVVSTIFDSLVNSYLAPYVGCALAEYLWQAVGQDVIVFYDDLTAHAHAYREISLLSGTSPGRDSYPGDIFHAHSSLLERAGKLAENHKCLTTVPIVLTEGGDISTYLPTNVMSITDGQWILDLEVFRTGLRPAINIGLSVTRVGNVGQNSRQKQQGGDVFKTWTSYEQAQEFAHFGAEMSAETKRTLLTGKRLTEIFTQIPGETYNLAAQQLMLDIVLSKDTPAELGIPALKQYASEMATSVKDENSYQNTLVGLKTRLGQATSDAKIINQTAPNPQPGASQ